MTDVHGTKKVHARCETCGKMFQHFSYLHQHQKTHNQLEKLCEICGKCIRGEIEMNIQLKKLRVNFAMKSSIMKAHSEPMEINIMKIGPNQNQQSQFVVNNTKLLEYLLYIKKPP